MREIKFRYIIAVNNYRNEEIKKISVILSLNQIKICDDFQLLISKKAFENGDINEDLLFYKIISENQYSGLKDKSGKEIYEGDIVVYDCDNFSVTWNDGSFHAHSEQEGVYDTGFWNITNNCKIIGNIYENPELLNEQQE